MKYYVIYDVWFEYWETIYHEFNDLDLAKECIEKCKKRGDIKNIIGPLQLVP